MKKFITTVVLLSLGLPAILLGGCGKKAEITEDRKAEFGVANQPMPPGVAEKIRAANEKGAQSRGGKPGVK